MGNIQHRLFPSSHNLDNPSTKSQQQNTSNRSELLFNTYNPKNQSLLQLTVSDGVELQTLMENIALYSISPQLYPSISSLKQYYKIKKQGYCTNQYNFYLIFNGCGCCGLKDQFGVRKMMGTRFSDQEIFAVLKTYLGGVSLYVKQFGRNLQKIDLDDIGFINMDNQTQANINHALIRNQFHGTNNIWQQTKNNINPVNMYFIDPWLKQKRQMEIVTVNEVNILLQNPSPQRLQQFYSSLNSFISSSHQKNFGDESYQNGCQQFSSHRKVCSLLFSVGVIGLKLLEMGFVDDIYVKSPKKKVNLQRIEQILEKHLVNGHNPKGNLLNNYNYTSNLTRQKLISGLKVLLLSGIPKQREKIFQFWSVQANQISQLSQIFLEGCGKFNKTASHAKVDHGISNSRSFTINPLNSQINPIRQNNLQDSKPRLCAKDEYPNAKDSQNHYAKLAQGRDYVYRIDQLKNTQQLTYNQVDLHHAKNLHLDPKTNSYRVSQPSQIRPNFLTHSQTQQPITHLPILKNQHYIIHQQKIVSKNYFNNLEYRPPASHYAL